MSLDFGLLTKLILTATSPEKFFDNDRDNAINSSNGDGSNQVATIITILVSLILGITAFTLSWTCNTAMGYTTVVKTVYGTASFIFGLTYILLYLLLRWDTCHFIIRKSKRV